MRQIYIIKMIPIKEIHPGPTSVFYMKDDNKKILEFPTRDHAQRELVKVQENLPWNYVYIVEEAFGVNKEGGEA
jgi:hypothetical protein